MLDGAGGDDVLYVLLGSDTLLGGAGNDTLFGGGGGFDFLEGGAGADQLNGIFGVRSAAAYETATRGVTADLQTASNNAGDAAGDTYSFITDIAGSAFADALRGDTQANEITGGLGNDTVLGRDGNDTIFGGDGDDWLYGNEGADTLSGEGGDDRLYGGMVQASCLATMVMITSAMMTVIPRLTGGTGLTRRHSGAEQMV